MGYKRWGTEVTHLSPVYTEGEGQAEGAAIFTEQKIRYHIYEPLHLVPKKIILAKSRYGNQLRSW